VQFRTCSYVFCTARVPFIIPGALEEEEGKDKESLTPKQKNLLRHRELFLSRQVETIPATHIRGKCSVTLLNETESLLSYLDKDVRV
jgi:metastasis-associated protein MTA